MRSTPRQQFSSSRACTLAAFLLGGMRSAPRQQLNSSASATAPHAISTCSNLRFTDPATVTVLCNYQQLMLQRHAIVTALCNMWQQQQQPCFSNPNCAAATAAHASATQRLQLHRQRRHCVQNQKHKHFSVFSERFSLNFSFSVSVMLQLQLQFQRHATTSTSASALSSASACHTLQRLFSERIQRNSRVGSIHAATLPHKHRACSAANLRRR
jgi:hypothetical protein